MQTANGYKYITTAATYNLFGSEVNRVVLHGIQINKTTTGTVTVKSGSTTIGIIALGTIPGTYWMSVGGIEIESANVVTSASEDITVYFTNIG